MQPEAQLQAQAEYMHSSYSSRDVEMILPMKMAVVQIVTD